MARVSIRGSRSGIAPWAIASARKRVHANLERSRLLAARQASLLFPLGGALGAKEHLLGDEHAVAHDLVIGQLEAVGAERTQRLARVGMARRDRIESLVQFAERLVEDHVQAVLLGVEVVIEGGRPDAHVIGDLGPFRVLIAVAPEAIDRSVENLGSPRALVPRAAVAGPAGRP